jgi:hypothetical protein
MKTKLDWHSFGQFFSTVLNLFTLIRTTFENMRIGLQIIPWILSEEGKPIFVECLTSLGEHYRKTVRVDVINETTLLVNLDAPLILPFDDAIVESVKGTGWVRVELRDSYIYVDDRRVLLETVTSLTGSSHRVMSGAAFLERVSTLNTLHPNILDALLSCRSMLPPSLFTAHGYQTITFAAVVFKSPVRKAHGISRFFGKTVMDPSQQFLRGLSVSGTPLSGMQQQRTIESCIDWMGTQFHSGTGAVAVLE